MTPFEWIALISLVGGPLVTLAKGVFGQKKLTRCQLLQAGEKLAWSVVEGAKRTTKMTQPQMTAAAEIALIKWANGKGLKVTPKELDAAKAGWELLSTAAKALTPPKRATTATK